MANEEHLKILKQGVKVWNKWREENPDVILDLRRAYFQEGDLSGTDLQETDLNEVELSSVKLSGMNLIEANFPPVQTSAGQSSSRRISAGQISAGRSSAKRTSIRPAFSEQTSAGRTSTRPTSSMQHSKRRTSTMQISAGRGFSNAFIKLVDAKPVIKKITDKPDDLLVGKAFEYLSNVFKRHFHDAMLEAGRYLIKEFYSDNYQLAAINKKVKKESLNSLIKQLQENSGNAPSKTWVYDAVRLAVDDHFYNNERFRAYQSILRTNHAIKR